MRSKARIIQTPVRRSPRKHPASTPMALPVLLAQDDEGHGKSGDPEKIIVETCSNSGENGDDQGIDAHVVEKGRDLSPRVGNNGGHCIDSDSLGFRSCVRCDVRDEFVLVCSEIGCSIAVHEKCMGCNPSFDGSGKFRCPVCERKQAVARVEEARRKVMAAKRALKLFLDGCPVGTDQKDRDFSDNARCEVEDRGKQPEAFHQNETSETEIRNEATDQTGERESQPETEACTKLPKRFKQRAGKRLNAIAYHQSPPREQRPFSRRKAIAKKSKQHAKLLQVYTFMRAHSALEKRKRLHWTQEEEEMLKRGVEELTGGINKKISWKSILEFGGQVFHPTRSPADLRDKWRHTMADRL